MTFDPRAVLRDGKQVDWLTDDAIKAAERKLKYRLSVVQGHNPSGVAASAGTHDRWGVVDLMPWDHENKVRALRAVGFAAWYRPAIPKLWSAHIHAVLIGHPDLAPAAARQVDAYRAHRDGLKSNAADNTWHPDPIPTFKPPKPLPAPTIDGVDISHHQGGELDWAKAKAAGVRFVYHKATQGTGFEDIRYAGRREEIAEAGLHFGAYHFADLAKPRSGRAQAKWFLETAQPRRGDMRPVLDLEPQKGVTTTAAQREQFAEDFVNEIRVEIGVWPIIYTPYDFTKWRGPLWVARYSDSNAEPPIPLPWWRHSIWQFSNGQFGNPKTVPGLGAVDINALHPAASLDRLRIPRKKATR